MARTLKGKRILLTGASTGIGRELARMLGAKGAKLALVARQIDKLKEAADEVRQAGGEAVVIPGDLTDPLTPSKVMDESVKALGGLDVLLNNAGWEPGIILRMGPRNTCAKCLRSIFCHLGVDAVGGEASDSGQPTGDIKHCVDDRAAGNARLQRIFGQQTCLGGVDRGSARGIPPFWDQRVAGVTRLDPIGFFQKCIGQQGQSAASYGKSPDPQPDRGSGG